MALFGWLLGLVYGPDEPLLTGILSGALVGLFGLRPAKAALGLLVGVALGSVFQALDSAPEPALIAAAVTLAYRLIAAVAYRGRPLGALGDLGCWSFHETKNVTAGEGGGTGAR